MDQNKLIASALPGHAICSQDQLEKYLINLFQGELSYIDVAKVWYHLQARQ